MSVLNEYHIDTIHMVWLLGITQQFADLVDVAGDHFYYVVVQYPLITGFSFLQCHMMLGIKDIPTTTCVLY